MTEAVINILPSALGVAISPLPIVALILTLMSKKAKLNGLAFLAGWILAIMLIGWIGISLLGESAATNNGPSVLSLWLQLIVGVLLLAMAVKNWLSRPRAGRPAVVPKWMAAVDKMRWYVALLLGVFFIALNPKNLALTLAGVSEITDANLPITDSYIILISYAVIASLSLVLPLIYLFVAGESAKKLLLKLKNWLVKYNAVIMAVILLVVGLKITIQAITGIYG